MQKPPQNSFSVSGVSLTPELCARAARREEAKRKRKGDDDVKGRDVLLAAGSKIQCSGSHLDSLERMMFGQTINQDWSGNFVR